MQCARVFETGRSFSVAWAPDGKRFVSGSDTGVVRVWDVDTGACEFEQDGIDCVAWSPDGKHIVSGSGYCMQFYDADTGECIHRVLLDADEPVACVAWSPDSQRVVTGDGYDYGMVQIWDVSTGTVTHTMLRHLASVSSVAWSPDGRHIISLGFDNALLMWDCETGYSVREIREHNRNCISAAAWSPDSTRIVLVGNFLRVINAFSGKCIYERDGDFWHVAWAPNGRWIATGSYNCKAHVWDADTGVCVRMLECNANDVRIAWSPDSRQLLSTSTDSKLCMWEVWSDRTNQHFESSALRSSVFFFACVFEAFELPVELWLLVLESSV